MHSIKEDREAPLVHSFEYSININRNQDYDSSSIIMD